jgi:Mrp family chromosome partitioning ATPase/capsular polysaccharide biosynthesis protein
VPVESGQSTTLRDIFAPLWTYKWFVLFAVVFATAGTYVYYDREPESYSASTKLYLAQEGDAALGLGAGFSDARTVANQAQLLQSRAVALDVKELIGFPGSPESLSGAVTASAAEETDFIVITATAGSSSAAQAIANGFARAFVELRSETRRSQIRKSLTALQEQRDQIPRDQANAAARAEISTRIRALRLVDSTAPGNAQQVDPATGGVLTSTSPKRYALFAFVLALLSASGLAYMRTRFDGRISTEAAAADAYGRPVLGTVPHDNGISYFEDGAPAVSPAAREAFRGLRVNLRLASLSKPIKILLVTSANPGEGKSTLVRNLALTLHEAGQRVAIVDADLRKPSLAPMFGVTPIAGLTDVLTGDTALEAAVLNVTAKSLPPAMSLATASDDGVAPSSERAVTLLSAGHVPANPPAVLESLEVREVLRRLGETHDYVLVDTPPLLSVSDAIPLLDAADAVIVPARIGSTTRRTAERATEILRRVPQANFIGVVANDVEVGIDTYYGESDYGGRAGTVPAPATAAESTSAAS